MQSKLFGQEDKLAENAGEQLLPYAETQSEVPELRFCNKCCLSLSKCNGAFALKAQALAHLAAQDYRQ